MSRGGEGFIEIETPPAETEELILVSLDDYKFGLDADYINGDGLSQLSTFFIGLRPQGDNGAGTYHVVYKPDSFQRPNLLVGAVASEDADRISAVRSGYYNGEIAGPYAASGGENAGTFTVPCRKITSYKIGDPYVDNTVRDAVERWGANLDTPPDGLTDNVIYSYIALDDRSLKGGGSRGQQGFQGGSGEAGPSGGFAGRGFQGFSGSAGPQGPSDGNQGAQGAGGPQGGSGPQGGMGPQGAGNQGLPGQQGMQGFQADPANPCATGMSFYNLVCYSGRARITDCGEGYSVAPSVHLTPNPSDPLFSCIGTQYFAAQAFSRQLSGCT